MRSLKTRKTAWNQSVMVCWLLFLLLWLCPLHAVVMRHDVHTEAYAVVKMPDYVVDLPHEGHAVLIEPDWLVTVAHTVFYDYSGETVHIAGQPQRIKKVIKHPGFDNPPVDVLTGDAAPLMQFLRHNHDLALIQLEQPVSKAVQPVNWQTATIEAGLRFVVYGRGAVGDGLRGEDSSTKSLKQANQFENIITEAQSQWITYRFDAPPDALPLEGMHGSGDSGSPLLIDLGGQQHLIGLSSWQYWHGELSAFKGGQYGTRAYAVNLRYYHNWMLKHISPGKVTD